MIVNKTALNNECTPSSARQGALLLKVIVIAAVLTVAVAGLLMFRKHRRENLIESALANGTKAYQKQQYSEAAGYFGRYLAAEPSDVDVLLKYADAQLHRRPESQGTIKQGISALERVLRIEAGHPEASEDLIKTYVRLGSYTDAERVARSWLEVEPENEKPAEFLAATLIAQGEKPEAREVLEQLVSKNPANVDAVVGLVLLRTEQQDADPESAMELMDQCIAASDGASAAYIARGKIRAAAGQWGQALQDALTAEKGADLTDEDRINLGVLLWGLGRQEKARSQFREVLAGPSPEMRHVTTIVQFALNQGDYLAGAEYVDGLLESLSPEQQYRILPQAAEFYLVAGQEAEAEACREKLLDMDAAQATISYIDGLAAFYDGRYEESVEKLKEVTGLQPQNPRGHLALARAYVRSNRLEEAVRSFESAIELSRGPATLIELELVSLYARMGRWQEAARTAERAERNAVASARYVSSLQRLLMQGQVARRQRAGEPNMQALAELEQQARQLMQIAPNEHQAQIVVAKLAAYQGDIDTAREILAPALTTQPDAEMTERLAKLQALVEILAEAGQYTEAIEVCEAAAEIAPQAEAAPFYGRLVALHQATQDTEGADQAISKLLNQSQGESRSKTVREVARVLFQGGQRSQAIELLKQYIAVDQGDVPARVMLLASMPLEPVTDYHQQIVDELKKAEGPEGAHWRIWQAQLWLTGGDWKTHQHEIETLADEAFRLEPKWSAPLQILGRLYRQAGDQARALEMFERALELEPGNQQIALQLLKQAYDMERWPQVERCLEILPVDVPAAFQARVALAWREGKLDEAERLLQRQCKQHPDDWASRLKLASLYRSRGQLDEAQELIQAAKQMAPDRSETTLASIEMDLTQANYDAALENATKLIASKDSPEARFLRASAYDALDQFDKAKADLQFLTTISGWEERALLAMGRLLVRHGRTEEALGFYRDATERLPDSVPLKVAMSQLLLGQRDERELVQEGRDLLAELEEQYSGHKAVVALRARLALKDNRRSDAEALYEQVLAKDSDSLEAMKALAAIKANKGESAAALTLTERGLRHDPADINLLVLQVRLLADIDPSRASEIAGKVLPRVKKYYQLDPVDAQRAILLAQMLFVANRQEEAIETLQDFASNPDSEDVLEAKLALARMNGHIGRLQRATEILQALIEAAPGDPRPVLIQLSLLAEQDDFDGIRELLKAYQQRSSPSGMVLLKGARLLTESTKQEDLQAAASAFEAARPFFPDSANLMLDLGLVWYTLGEIPKARECFEAVLKIQPGRVDAVNNLAWLLCEEQNSPHEAAKVLEQVPEGVETHPDYVHVLDTYGVVEYRLGLLEESEEHFEQSAAYLEKALGLITDDLRSLSTTRFHLARTLAHTDRDRSLQMLRQLKSEPSMFRTLSPAAQQEVRQLLDRLESAQAAG
jgi:tetratricopeptide (TPR) repeat protein